MIFLLLFSCVIFLLIYCCVRAGSEAEKALADKIKEDNNKWKLQ